MNLLAHQLRVSAIEAEVTRFQRFARDAPIGILFISSDATVQFANDEYLRIIDRSREEFEAERFRPRAEPVCPSGCAPSSAPRHETEYVRRDGTRVPILVGLSRQQDGVAAFVIDLTSEKAAQRARQESEERYRAIAEQLAEADRRKDEFFRILSHELRNPLAPIRNALHLLARAPDDPARAARAREVIERQIGHLSRLVDDLLDVTRITRGRIQLHREPRSISRASSARRSRTTAPGSRRSASPSSCSCRPRPSRSRATRRGSRRSWETCSPTRRSSRRAAAP